MYNKFLIVRKTQSRKVHPRDIIGVITDAATALELASELSKGDRETFEFLGVLPLWQNPALSKYRPPQYEIMSVSDIDFKLANDLHRIGGRIFGTPKLVPKDLDNAPDKGEA